MNVFQNNKAEDSTGLLFIKTYNKWHTEVKTALRAVGITHPQFVVMTTLAYLAQTEEFVTQVQIAKLSDIDVMTVSQIVSLLERHGFIARSPNPKDTRAKAVRLLPKGEDAVRQAFPIVVGIDKKFFGSLGERESSFLAALKILVQGAS